MSQTILYFRVGKAEQTIAHQRKQIEAAGFIRASGHHCDLLTPSPTMAVLHAGYVLAVTPIE